MMLLRSAALAAGVVLVLAGCGETADVTVDATDVATDPADAATAAPTDAPTASATDQTEAAEDGQATDPAASADAAVVTVATTDLGDILVDGDGMTLYLFDPDEQGPSTCEGDCAGNWPPLLTDEQPTAGEGADAGLLGTSERPDGTLQVTYDGWPLYRWQGDQSAGDTTGQGVGGVWWVVAPDGTPVREAAGTSGAETGGTATAGGASRDY